MSSRKQLVEWLNDAHSMEVSLVQVLEDHVKKANDYPEIQICLEQHVEETKEHAKKLEQCLRLLGETPSRAKGGVAFFTSAGRTKETRMFQDEILKNLLSDYAAEHMEIGSYIALTIAAEELGQFRIADLCQEILEEEQEMVEWLEEQLPQIARRALQRGATFAPTRERHPSPKQLSAARANANFGRSPSFNYEKTRHESPVTTHRINVERG